MKLIKIIYLLFFLVFFKINTVLAQKKLIDSNAYGRWSSLGQADISPSGKYVTYTIENEPLGSQTLVLQSTESNWKRSFIGAKDRHLLTGKGGDYAVFLNQSDSLVIVSLGKDLIQYLPDVSSFSIFPTEENEWITYQLKQSNEELIIQNLHTGKKHLFAGVINKVMGEDGQTIILQTEKKVDRKTIQELNWINVATGKSNLVWQGLKAEGIVPDFKHNQLVFTAENSILYYNKSQNKMICLVNSQSEDIDPRLKLGQVTRFSNDGKRLFIFLQEEDKPKPKAGVVEVWNYLDHKLQPQQENEIGARTYAATVNLTDGKITQLEQEFEHLMVNSFEKLSDTVGIICRDGKRRDGVLSVDERGICDLIFLKNGKRTRLEYRPMGLSPYGKYVVYHDLEQGTYVSRNLKTGVLNNISKAFSETTTEQGFQRREIAGWLDDDESVLFYDNYDIWKMDLSGQNAPINLTSQYGKAHSFVFSIVYGQYDPYPLRKNQKIILSAFNLQSKKNGFYSLELNNSKNLQQLSIGDYIYYTPEVGEMEHSGFMPIKAKKAEVYMVHRMSAKESPNYFSTTDFKTFRPLSNVSPERDYNWFSTELHTWHSLDGKNLQGVLYKPDNFDPNKKYPVIFYYYELLSNSLNAYKKPEALWNGSSINIATYVSNGYLVFTPDIIYKMGDPMQGTYDAVVSAAKYIGALPFVDRTKMGIQGCSWGGVQTNYLVTHTNLFAAACSSSGIADWIANFGRLRDGLAIEGRGQFRMEKSIWEVPGAYIKSSPIFQLDKVTTPLLIMHTRKDEACSFDDAIELFTGLRRLGKRSWLLAYPEGNHGVSGKEATDFSIRMMQFFDHYLKDEPAPIWMTRGIPAERKGLDDGLAYDKKIKTPGPGLVTADEQRIVDSLLIRKPITITLR